MARPYSEGRLQYFPMDCVLNDAMKLLEAEFGLTAFAVVVKLWQKIYAGRGYYCEWTREVALVFSQEIGVGANVVSEILSSAFKRGIFDRGLFDRYGILTSDGIQKRYFEAVKRRKQISVDERFLLVSVAQKEINADNNSVNVNINEVNADDNSQSKVKESKVNKNKVNESRVVAESDGGDTKTAMIRNSLNEYPNVILSKENVKSLLERMGEVSAVMHYIKKLSDFIGERGANVRNHCATIMKWYEEDMRGGRAGDGREAAALSGKYDDIWKINRDYLMSLKDEEV